MTTNIKYRDCEWLQEPRSNEYTQAVERVMEQLKFHVTIRFIAQSFPGWDSKEFHNEFRITVSRGKNRFSFKFWDSINSTQHNECPTAYDVLCRVDFNDPGSYEYWCSNFGYSTDSIRAARAYKETVRLAHHYNKMFSPSELELISEECQ